MDFDEEDPFDDSSQKLSRKPARAGRRFQPRAKSQTTKPVSKANEKDIITQSATTQAGSADILVEPTLSTAEAGFTIERKAPSNEESIIPASIGSESRVDDLADKSGFQNADVFSNSDYLDDLLINTSLEVGDTTDYNQNVDMDTEQTENCIVQTQTSIDSAFNVTEAIHEFEMPDIEPDGTIAPGRRARKFQPKPKMQSRKEKPTTTSHPDSTNCQFNPSQTENVEEDLPNVDCDYSSLNLGDSIPSNPTSTELPVNEDAANLPETSQANPTNLSVSGGEHDNDDDEVVLDSSKKKKPQRKSKKPETDIEKPVTKRKKTNKTQDEVTKEEPRKKFSHSSRRNKRTVDKALLLLPDDEIDFRNMPMKDLILLAEHKERIAKKEEKSNETLTANQSNENSLHEKENNSVLEEDYDRDHRYDSEYDDDQYDDSDFTAHQASYKTEADSTYFNYQSFMKKEPRSRWSKQDTELFYEAVGQFGTDFSLIQQLFPGKTRHQIKLKYKKEQRQNPLRLCDAETNRSKDHCHFEKLIEQLQQASAASRAELEEENDDDSFYNAGDEVDELATEVNNEEVAKSEANENAKEAEVGACDINNLSKSDEDEDDGDDDYQVDY